MNFIQSNKTDPIINRLYHLDYLRGLSAFGIMIYHYMSSTNGRFLSETFLARLGIYGVSIFYILSGLTLYYVYYDKMKPSKEDVISFLKKRIFRIFPLLWLVTIISIILSRAVPDFTSLFLTLTGLFGFLNWDKYFSVGVWSIGNELVFYFFFPFFILFYKKFKFLMLVVTIAIFSLYIYYAYVKLNPNLKFDDQWINYVNPLNQVLLFLGGFLIGLFFRYISIKNSIVILLLIFGFATLSFYPASGDIINLVTGTNRLVFTFCCFLICVCFYKMTLKFPKFIHYPLTLLGNMSYSVYLLHPIVWIFTGIFSKYIYYIPKLGSVIISIILTLVISRYVYKYFELYFINLGQTNKIANK